MLSFKDGVLEISGTFDSGEDAKITVDDLKKKVENTI
jgi:hypothetical protein